MGEFIKNYHITMTALAPIHIGDGTKITNREYLFVENEGKVIVPDLPVMYQDIIKSRLEREFQNFMLYKKRPLMEWMGQYGFVTADFKKWKKYELDAGEYFMPGSYSGKAYRPEKDILAFNKDAYGCPYVPGSSLKGMIRTALLVWIIKKDPAKYRTALSNILSMSGQKKNRKYYLQGETSALEEQVFHTLEKSEKKKNAVNSIMSGFIVSDSKPMDISVLTLSQKIDVLPDQTEKRLPILRETIKPGTSIEFDLALDNSEFSYTIEDILEALDEYNAQYYENYARLFKKGNPEPGIVWLGSGVGFGEKTIVYSLYNREEALRLTDNILKVSIGNKYQEHHHDRDVQRGIAPHTYKCTRYDGKLYDMGMAKIEKYCEV